MVSHQDLLALGLESATWRIYTVTLAQRHGSQKLRVLLRYIYFGSIVWPATTLEVSLLGQRQVLRICRRPETTCTENLWSSRTTGTEILWSSRNHRYRESVVVQKPQVQRICGRPLGFVLRV